MHWTIEEIREGVNGQTLPSKKVAVYPEQEEAPWDDWDVWMSIAESVSSKVTLYRNGVVVSSYDQRERGEREDV